MSQVSKCPTCGAFAKVKEVEGQTVYSAVQDDEAIKKIGQLQKAMQKYKSKAEELEQQLAALQSQV